MKAKTKRPKRQDSRTIRYEFRVFIDKENSTIITKSGGLGPYKRRPLRININGIDIFNGNFWWRDWGYEDSFENRLLAKLSTYFKIDIRRRILKKISKKKEIKSIHKLPHNVKLISTEEISIEGIINATEYLYSVDVWYFYETVSKQK